MKFGKRLLDSFTLGTSFGMCDFVRLCAMFGSSIYCMLGVDERQGEQHYLLLLG